MKNEEKVLNALRVLKERDVAIEAPPEVEIRLQSAFRAASERRRKLKRIRYGVVAALAAAAGIVAMLSVRPRQHEEQKHPVIAVGPLQSPAQPVQAESRLNAVPVAATPVRKTVRRRPQPQQPQEVATEFFPLIDAPPPFERGELVRVAVPAATMRKVGLPVSEDHLADLVKADILIGQEGLARAIRFVKTSGD